MKHIVLCFSLLAVAASSTISQVQAAPKGDLKVVFTGLTRNVGYVRVALVNTKAGYKDEENHGFRLAEVKVKDFKAECTFSDIPLGTYSVKAFHDLDGDEQLDKGLFGIPLEPYGFSNNVRGTFGPPSYESTRFRFRTISGRISIKLA
jgi:uncharacterized protein (DUF2141 family)